MSNQTAKTKIALETLKKEAKLLVEAGGLLQKDIAEKLGVSEKTITMWIIDGKWVKKSPGMQKYNAVYQLVVRQRFQQKEAAIMVGVSEKTVSHWAIANNWKADIANSNANQKSELKAFEQFVALTHPGYKAKTVGLLVDEYLSQLKQA